MARRTKEEAEETKQAISLAALEIFCEKGYSRTTFDEIAKRINLTKGAVYWHFRNKADILGEIIRKSFEITRNIIATKVPQIDSLESLKQYFHEEINLVEHSKIFHQYLYFVIHQMEWSEAILNKVSNDMKDIEEFNREQIKKAIEQAQKNNQIRDDVDSEDATSCIACMWMGLIRGIVIPGANYNQYRKLLDSSFDIILNGLKTEGNN